MRSLPYTVDEIAECLGRIAMLHVLGFADASSQARRECLDIHFGTPKEVAFGTVDGAGTQAWATAAALLASVRQDMQSLLTDEHKSRASDISELFKVIYNPRLMFEFEPWKRIFAHELIPSQVLDRRQLILFNPATVYTFGNP